MNNNLLDLFSRLMSGQNFFGPMAPGQNPNMQSQNNNQNNNTGFENQKGYNYYPSDAYPPTANQEQNNGNINSLLPTLLSLLGNNNGNILNNLFKTSSLKEDDNKKEENHSPPNSELLL